VKYSTFSTENIEFTNEPLFLGKGRNVARLDLPIEQEIQKRTDKALGLMWFKTDFSYKKDGEDYAVMAQPLKTLFDKNLKFQTVGDSVAARSVSEVFGPITTNPQLEEWWFQHAFYEGVIHSPTYAEILKSLPVDAKEVFDDIIINDHIIERGLAIANVFDDTIAWNSKMVLQTSDYDEYSHMKSIALSLYALNILEAVFFKSSFVTTFAFAENHIMESSAKAITKISMDEIMHYQMTVYVIKRLKTDTEWAAAFAEVEDQAVAMYQQAYNTDLEWIDYCYSENEHVPLLGVSNSILKQYVQYNMYNVMTNVKLPHIVKRTKNPCIWVDKYSNLSNVQVAMKETDSANYLLGKLDTEASNEDYRKFLL